ncbi:MAG: NUDIX domain-containing protein [Polaribacter sp.]|jgi:8-oxo-dGTP pyrophosphatase MutT (NUDIX family)|nr:NUDIX domain-containing protein [Polaribacter sp.]
MPQMYKVFVNDKPIILTDSLKKNNNFRVYLFKDVVVDEILHKLKRGNSKGVNLFCANLERDWKTFKKHFKVVSAAGGLVLNPDNEILFIYRLGIWDLPKGRIEIGETIEETAVREVEEECGVAGLILEKPLITTYHLFFMDDIQQLKITHWFLMKTDFQEKLTPQLEEGITKVVFKNETQVQQAKQNTYANIKLVLDAYKQV